ncbi:MAG: SDR family NAD(P)-dependent oxidoreductase [Gammaproteobacteria bacterium]|nr:MAG: SDR family NAD(P)-dependent oxidoreductase [Gammaproteobacteria bacterium]
MLPEKTRILVTGGCGSVGSALVQRLLEEGHTVCAFDQSEDGLFKLEQELKDKANGRLKLFLGNVRDENRLRRAMEGVQLVFHCAALKHVYLSEYNPFEAMLTNIDGTNNVIQAAVAAEVERVVITSSDKAVNPTSTMGATKLLGERLFVAANHYAGHKTRFACVRFGNVLNSNGSVLQIFKRQIENKLPLTITSTEMTRFYISMDQAVDLCITASERMIGGEIFVMSMGSSDIMSLAKAISDNEEFNYTEIGHKPGEKLYEELVTESEAPRTAFDGSTYIVLPDTMDMMPANIRDEYSVYNEHPKLSAPLRSDEDLLSVADVKKMLFSAGLL